MTCTHLPLSFSVDNDAIFDTLEAVLAIARRGGLHLSSLHLHDGNSGRVCMELLAPEPCPLDLFVARLHNVIGVHDLEVAAAAGLPSAKDMHVAIFEELHDTPTVAHP